MPREIATHDRRALFVLGSVLVVLLLTMPAAHAEMRGAVRMLVNPDAPRDDWRRVPLPAAYIAVFWSVTVLAPASAVTTCRYSEIARSDERGEYVMEGPDFITAGLAKTSYLVYSPGLDSINFPYEGSPQSVTDITMARSTLASHERLSRLAGYVDSGCGELNDPHNLLGAFHRGLLDEARSLHVESDRGRRDLQSIEAAARRSYDLDQPGPIRAVIRPSSGAIQSNSPLPE